MVGMRSRNRSKLFGPALFFLFSLIVSCLVATAVEAAPSEPAPLPGNTLAERHIHLALAVMDRAIDSCLADADACRLTAAETEALKKIRALPATAKTPALLQFKSAAENPDLFDLSGDGLGCGRVAVTGDAADSPIIFNTDAINIGEGMSFGTALALVIHEFGHHVGYQDDSAHFLDNVGTKIQLFFERQLLRVSQPTSGASRITVMVHNFSRTPVGRDAQLRTKAEPLPLIILQDPQHLYQWELRPTNLTQSGAGTDAAPLVCGQVDNLRGVWLSGLMWTSPPTWDPANQKLSLVAAAHAQIACAHGPDAPLTYPPGHNLLVAFDVQAAADANGNPNDDPNQAIVLGTVQAAINDNPDNDPGAASWLTISSLSSNADNLNAGDMWTFDAVVESPVDINVASCGANITSDDFNYRYSNGVTYAFIAHTCEFAQVGPRAYKVRATYRFAATSPSRTYRILNIALSANGENYISGYPAFSQTVKVKGADQVANPRMASYSLASQAGEIQFPGSPDFTRQYAVGRGEAFKLKLQIDSAVDFVDAWLALETFAHYNEQTVRWGVLIPLDVETPWNNRCSQTRHGASLSIECSLVMPETQGAAAIFYSHFSKFIMVTSDLRELIFAWPQTDFSVVFADAIPRS